MTTCREIITRSLQIARVVGVGRNPRANESEIGLETLQGMYNNMFSNGMFGRLKDVYATADYTAKEGERIIADSATITIPDVIEESGEDRVPRDLSGIVVVTDTDELNYVFSNGRWELASNLTLDDTAPLASRDLIGLAAALAIDLGAIFGKEVLPEMKRRGVMFKGSISMKQASTQPARESVYF